MAPTIPVQGAPSAPDGPASAAPAAAGEELGAQLEEAQRRIAFLYEVTSALFKDARGQRTTLANLARLVVPHLADWCLIHAVGEATLERVAAEHWNPDLVERARTLDEVLPLARGRGGVAEAVASGRAVLVDDATPPGGAPGVQDPEPPDVGALRTLGARSWLQLPLSVRGRPVAVATLAYAESMRRYGPADVALAEDLAARAAMALENAALFEEVERAVQAREDTLSVVSHDLKNPMSALLLGVQRLARLADEARRPQADALLERLERTVRGMNRLIEGLLDLARIEAGRLRLDRRREPPAAVLGRALEPLEPLAADKKLRLELQLADGLPEVEWDPDRISQVLANLVGNAIKFTPEGGGIRVRAEQEAAQLRVSVSDDGPGIPGEQRHHLFDRYWQPPGGQKRGHGLGLYIVKGIVEAHGGRVWVESEVGRGSTFLFTVPLAA